MKKDKTPKKLGPKEKLEQALNIAAKELGVTVAPIQPEILLPNKTSQNIETREDYDFVRKNLKNLIEVGNTALEQLNEIIEEGGAPREFEVLAQLIKALTETTRELIQIQREMREIEKQDKELGKNREQSLGEISATITSSDLLKMIKELPQISSGEK